MKVKFICGCTTGEIIDRENIETMDAVTYDADGMLMCAIHHERRYGYRSLPTIGPSQYPDYMYASLSLVDLEACIVFNDGPLQKVALGAALPEPDDGLEAIRVTPEQAKMLRDMWDGDGS